MKFNRFFGLVVRGAVLAGCASTGGPQTGPVDEPVIAYSGPLGGATPKQVEGKLGKPNIVREEGGGALWTYRFPNCALLVGFAGTGAARRVASIDAGPRFAGQPAPSRDACIAEGSR